MTDMFCTLSGDRDERIVAYLYDDIDPIDRASFDAHLASCGRCRADLADLRGVRADLAKWAPPEPAFTVVAARGHEPAAIGWRSIPAWAQVAAALLVFGVSAGIANLNVHYGTDGLTIRTGWSRSGVAAQNEAAKGADALELSAAKAAWRADLTALGQQLRGEFHAANAATAGVRNTSTSSNDPDLVRRIRALEDASRQQRNDFSLQLAAALRDVNAQRRADLVRIDQNLGFIQNNTGIEVAKQREMLNYLVRVSSQK
jgi:hypothetical protein